VRYAGKALSLLSSGKKMEQFPESTSGKSEIIPCETDFLTGPPGQNIIIDELAWQSVSKYESTHTGANQ
jgi:hypothetical protein